MIVHGSGYPHFTYVVWYFSVHLLDQINATLVLPLQEKLDLSNVANYLTSIALDFPTLKSLLDEPYVIL